MGAWRKSTFSTRIDNYLSLFFFPVKIDLEDSLQNCKMRFDDIIEAPHTPKRVYRLLMETMHTPNCRPSSWASNLLQVLGVPDFQPAVRRNWWLRCTKGNTNRSLYSTTNHNWWRSCAPRGSYGRFMYSLLVWFDNSVYQKAKSLTSRVPIFRPDILMEDVNHGDPTARRVVGPGRFDNSDL